MKKRIVFWGAGAMCRDLLKRNKDLRPEYIIDSDESKKGTCLSGIEIVSPQKLLEDRGVFVLITSRYEKEISDRLRAFGLAEGTDYMGVGSLYGQPVPMDTVQEALEEEFFQSDWLKRELWQRVDSMEDYQAFLQKIPQGILFEKSLARIYYRMPGKMGGYRGYCEICNSEQDLQVDYFWSDTKEPAWRETLTCPRCQCNSRMRFMAGYLREHHRTDRVYCYEAVTPFYKHLHAFMEDLTGSEYLGEHLASGAVVDGIMHQDAMDMSFKDAAFDVMVSCDVLEHVADHRAALKEAYRCLAPRGRLLVSIPVFKDRYETVVRTVRSGKGELSYPLPPVYHGDPLSGQGALVFREFGWSFLDDLRGAGFREAWALVYFSVPKGYLGGMPVIFIAEK